MQEEVNQKTMALSIRASKLTGKVLAAAFSKVVRAAKGPPPEGADPEGPPERGKADEPLRGEKFHALCGSPEGL